MATTLFVSILALACAFMFYVLVQVHLETKRPRKMAPLPFRGNVVPFRTIADARRHVAAHAVGQVGQAYTTQLTAAAGFRRLGVKRAGRS
jgi:hypothetical protein